MDLKRSYWRAFDRKFFVNHQEKLLWLLNTPVVGRWFRYCMRIRGRERFIGILPHATFWEKDGKVVADFRTHPKYSKRLYYAFRYLWWACHYWDEFLADKWTPRLSLGFATLTKYPDEDPESATVDGETYRSEVAEGVAWSTLHDATDAHSAADAGLYFRVKISGGTTTNQWRRMHRSYFLFDTSALTSDATISSATVSLYGDGVSGEHFDTATWTPEVSANIYSSNPASNTAIGTADYDQVGTTAYCDTAIAYSSISTAAYNDFLLNSTGQAAVNKTGITKFGSRDASYDVPNSAPTWKASTTSISFLAAENTGTANDPKLVVVYSLPGWFSDARIIFISRSDGTVE